MMLGFMLSALFYKERNEKPFRFIAALSVICGASAYGILLAAGISIAWLWEILGKQASVDKTRLFLKSRVFHALLILLVYNILLLLCIYPFDDTFGMTVSDNRSTIVMIIYMFLMAPSNAICCIEPRVGVMSPETLLISIFVSILIDILLFRLAKKVNKLALFIVPYMILSIFASFIYFSIHHTGVITMLYLFLLWCFFDGMLNDSDEVNLLQKSNELNQKWLRYASRALISIVIGISVYWSVSASVRDVFTNYGTGRETAKFITDNNLDSKNIMVAWLRNKNEKTGEIHDDYNYLQGVLVLAYFDKNIFYNFNNKLDNKCYLLHSINTDNSIVDELIKNHYPEVLLGTDSEYYTFGSDIKMEDFALVKSVHGARIWKDITIDDRQYVYIRKDLLKNYPNLHELNIEDERVD
ncbi:MAG TPA: hypothetical protein VHT96_14670 [Clostridia bacterium]|nr:hypothetical protein [Clostridia bacterium]